jgi:hypothetical protein
MQTHEQGTEDEQGGQYRDENQQEEEEGEGVKQKRDGH